ncbi:MAG: alginate lyase family protein, partial [Clostridia bacterium]|nr:alginate lyase family protein [Clostridia bacterium]
LMEACGGRALEDVKAWFADYLHWLTTSENGLEAKSQPNNHANWWNSQAAAYAALVEDEATLKACFDRFTQHIIPAQTDDDGSFTEEKTRTLSYGYSLFSLDACATLCEIAWHRGVDLWHAQLENGKGMARSVAFFKPYYINPFLWEYQQINAGTCFDERYSMKLAARRLGDEQIGAENERRREDKIPCGKKCYIGLLDLL